MNLSVLLSIMSAAPAIVGMVNNTVHEVESAFPGFAGNVKFSAAEAKVNSFLAAAVTDASELANLQSVVGVLINASVAMFNAAGLFKKSAK